MAEPSERAAMLRIVQEAWSAADAGPLALREVDAIAAGLLAAGLVPRRANPPHHAAPPARDAAWDQAFASGQLQGDP